MYYKIMYIIWNSFYLNYTSYDWKSVPTESFFKLRNGEETDLSDEIDTKLSWRIWTKIGITEFKKNWYKPYIPVLRFQYNGSTTRRDSPAASVQCVALQHRLCRLSMVETAEFSCSSEEEPRLLSRQESSIQIKYVFTAPGCPSSFPWGRSCASL